LIMCGRYCIAASPGEMAEHYKVTVPKTCLPRYNIAPSELIPVVVPDGLTKKIRIGQFGFSSGLKTRIINARVESVLEKPLFKSQLRSGRCLVPASGYYEWKTSEGKKEPWYIYLPELPIISFAGLIRKVRESYEIVILTTSATMPVREVHPRMPLVLSRLGEEEYLAGKSPADLNSPDSTCYRMHKVSTRVNKTGEEGPDLILPVIINKAQRTLDMI